MDDLVAKLLKSGAATTVIAPYWPKKPWFSHLSEMASKTIDDMPPSRYLFSPQKRLGQGGVGPELQNMLYLASVCT
jgi:hypothetical protein